MPSLIELGVIVLVIMLSLIALGLIFNAPPDYINPRAVYQGF